MHWKMLHINIYKTKLAVNKRPSTHMASLRDNRGDEKTLYETPTKKPVLEISSYPDNVRKNRIRRKEKKNKTCISMQQNENNFTTDKTDITADI
uniref:Uncharacterized protein n=1 Tax=Arion vulgaris TaxID=1028688 RepID=A0A0B6YY95_9EUPU